MAQSILMQRFLQALFGNQGTAAEGAENGRAIRVARSLPAPAKPVARFRSVRVSHAGAVAGHRPSGLGVLV